MRTTLSIIKADIGSIGGHIRPSDQLLERVRQFVDNKSKGLVNDFYVSYTGDDIALLFSHQKGARQDLLKHAFSGNVKGMGPAVAEMEFEERPNEPFLFFAADKTDPGAYNLPLFLASADTGRDVFRSRKVVIIPTLLSSPSDVDLPRTRAEKAVFRFNQYAVENRGIFLKLVRWEDMAPQIGPAAQQVINKQITDYDIFCGIMWNRFGKPTEKGGSGTEEEFNAAVQSWKSEGKPWIIFYFCDRPATFSTMEQLKQKRKVLKFRDRLNDMGVVRTFVTVQEFEKLLYEDLNKITKQPDFLQMLASH